MVRRLVQLYVGLGLYGLSTAMFIRSDLGVDPWDVFHLGVAIQTGMSIGTVIILTGAAVLLLWIPLRQLPGLGTISNVICIGLAADASMALILSSPRCPCASPCWFPALWLTPLPPGCISARVLAQAARRPDDRHTRPAGLVDPQRAYRDRGDCVDRRLPPRGAFGVGTVLYALTIGPLIQLCLPWFRPRPRIQKAPQPERIV